MAGKALPKLMEEDKQVRAVVVENPVKDAEGRYVSGLVNCRVESPNIFYSVWEDRRENQTRREGQKITHEGSFREILYMMANFWVEEGVEFVEVYNQ